MSRLWPGPAWIPAVISGFQPYSDSYRAGVSPGPDPEILPRF